MITVEMLNAQTALSGLTEEQRQAICLLSKNDEEAVMGNRFREVYNRLDETIAKETGIQRNGDEKTYNYLERAARELAGRVNSVEGLNVRIRELTGERDRLKKAVEEGAADENLKKQLTQAQKDLASVTEKFNTLKADYDKAKSDHAAEMLSFRIDNEISASRGGIKFKPDLPEAAQKVLMEQAIQRVKSLKNEFIDDGNGGQRLVFKDANDAVMRNPENSLMPYTPAELLTKELKAMGVLDEGRQMPGTGTKPPVAKTTEGKFVIDVTGARTQTEAQELIAQTLMRNGLVNGTREFQEAMDSTWKDNYENVKSLPVQ